MLTRALKILQSNIELTSILRTSKRKSHWFLPLGREPWLVKWLVVQDTNWNSAGSCYMVDFDFLPCRKLPNEETYLSEYARFFCDFQGSLRVEWLIVKFVCWKFVLFQIFVRSFGNLWLVNFLYSLAVLEYIFYWKMYEFIVN